MRIPAAGAQRDSRRGLIDLHEVQGASRQPDLRRDTSVEKRVVLFDAVGENEAAVVYAGDEGKAVFLLYRAACWAPAWPSDASPS